MEKEEITRKDVDYSSPEGNVVHQVKNLYDEFHKYVGAMNDIDQGLVRLMHGLDAVLYEQAGYSLLKKADKQEEEDDLFINTKI